MHTAYDSGVHSQPQQAAGFQKILITTCEHWPGNADRQSRCSCSPCRWCCDKGGAREVDMDAAAHPCSPVSRAPNQKAASSHPALGTSCRAAAFCRCPTCSCLHKVWYQCQCHCSMTLCSLTGTLCACRLNRWQRCTRVPSALSTLYSVSGAPSNSTLHPSKWTAVQWGPNLPHCVLILSGSMTVLPMPPGLVCMYLGRGM